MRMPAAGNRKFDFLIALEDASRSGRSIRILVMSSPRDGDKMIAWEYGASKCEPGAVHAVDGTLTSQKIFHSTWQ